MSQVIGFNILPDRSKVLIKIFISGVGMFWGNTKELAAISVVVWPLVIDTSVAAIAWFRSSFSILAIWPRLCCEPASVSLNWPKWTKTDFSV